MAADFYVYEHWRPDLDVCFYVGKGRGPRAWILRRRNPYYKNIIGKLARLGLYAEVRLVEGGLDEQSALDLEVRRIAFWRRSGVRIANVTDGGDGVSGLKHSAETRKKMKEKRPLQSREKHREIMTGRSLPKAHRANISRGITGRKVSEKTRLKIAEANRGKSRSMETRERLSAAHVGKTHSEETRNRMRESQLARWARIKESI